MRALICIFACSFAACSSFEPRDDPFADFQQIARESVAEPAETPEFPVMEEGEGETVLLVRDGEQIGRLTASGAAWLSRVDSIAHGNEDIAAGHAEALRAAQTERDEILLLGQVEHERAEHQRRMLMEERRARFWSKVQWGSAGVLGLIIGLQ